MKYPKLLLMIAGIMAIGLFLRTCYTALCISCTPAPVKVYNYNGTMEQFEIKFRLFASAHPDLNYKLSRRGKESYAARDLIVTKADDIDSIMYNLSIGDFNGQTEVTLNSVHNLIANSGGCDSNDPEVKRLFNRFKKEILLPMKNEQNINLKPQWVYF